MLHPRTPIGAARRLGRRFVCAVAALAVAAAVGAPGATASASGAAAGASGPSVASIPAAVQPLVQKVAQAAVNSERYSVTTVAVGTKTVGPRGHRHKVSTRMRSTVYGEASLAPLLGKRYLHGDSGPLREVAIGSTFYLYDPTLTGSRARPWAKSALTAAALFPYHGGLAPSEEVDAGGTGAYAELLDLLATALGPVQIVGPAPVAGRQTTEIAATVQPLALVQGTPASEVGESTVRLEAFVSEAGVPLRVVRSVGSLVETTEVLAIDVPVSAKAPPARLTVGKRAVERRIESNTGQPKK